MPVIMDSAQARADVAAYLASLKGTPGSDTPRQDAEEESNSLASVRQQGKEMIEALGCRACHQDDSLALDGLSSKYSAASLPGICWIRWR
jgi:mono/diheme cytochrome c family protein